MPSIIVFGATGFVGAPVIRELKKTHPSWSITAYVRNKSPAEVKKNLGVDRVVLGNFSDFEKIKSLSKEHDIAFNAGSSFSRDLVSAIVAGLKERPNDSKGKLVHISGAGNFIDSGTTGDFNPESKDENEDDIRSITEDVLNGPSDTVVLEAGEDNAVETYVVCFPVTYGGAAAEALGIEVGYSIVAGNAKPLGYAPYIGDGSAVLSVLHLQDAIPFLIKLFEFAASYPAEGSTYSRYYILETERVQWKALATELAKVMFDKGLFKSPNARQVNMDQAGEGEAKYLIAANMMVEGNRAAKMGFKASHPSILEEIHKDLKSADL